MNRIVRNLCCLLALCAGPSAMTLGATPLIVPVDLPALIDPVADQPERFAVDVPKQLSATTDGRWTSSGNLETWTVSVQIPTAVSLSFHAAHLTLPSSATLAVTGSKATVTYHAADAHNGALWARPLVGDTLTLSISVPAADAAGVRFEIDRLQAGYRGLGGVSSHPYFIKKMGIKAATQSCSQNYACNATTANRGPANATVAVVVGNLYQCTGTLLNDTAGDFRPYVLTARHCQTGILGRDAAEAAVSTTIYWDAVSPCGATLGSIYDGSTPSQGGAVTMAEQQDAWLIRLDEFPAAADAYWAGWDASGSAFNGGYGVHHALGNDKQFVAWYGQAVLENIPGTTLNVSYASTFWGLVNQLGNVGAGASGGGLFDSNDRLVGSSSLAALQNGANSAGVCPVTPIAAPSASTATALYTTLAGVFASTADTTSSTPGVTIQSVLDAAGTGKQVIDGTGHLYVTLTVDQNSPTTSQTATLTWSAPGAQTCTASGGATGDGWSGTKPASGTAAVTEFPGGLITYILNCSGTGGLGSAAVDVDWIDNASISVLGPPNPVSIGSTFTLSWTSTLGPCNAAGGVTGDGWTGAKSTDNGQQIVTAAQVGSFTYSLTCGTSPRSLSTSATATVVPVQVVLHSDSTQLRVGAYANLNWTSPAYLGNCTATGGSSTDHWTDVSAEGSPGSDFVTETTAGTYTYRMHCAGGGQTSDSSVTILFTNDPAAISLTPVSATQSVYTASAIGTSAVTADLSWTANVTGCSLADLGYANNNSFEVPLLGQYPNGTAAASELVAGLYTYQFHCGGLVTSATIDWTNSHPTITVTAPSTTWAADNPYTVSWSSNTEPCTQTGGVTNDGWVVSSPGISGQTTVTETQPGNYTFTLSCGTGVSTGQAQLTVTVPTPAVTISTDRSTVTAGQTVTLSWNSTLAPCSLVDPTDYPNGPISASVNSSQLLLELTPGTYVYSISCGSGQMVNASTTVTVDAPVPTTLTASEATAAVNSPITLTWNSSGAEPCAATFGSGVDGWSGSLSNSGSATVTEPTTGTVTYGVDCGTAAEVQVAYTAPTGTLTQVAPPTVALTSSLAAQVAGQAVTLTWSAKNSNACIASGGTSGDGWTGTLAPSGSQSVIESTAVNATYTITCTGAPPAAAAQATVKFQAASGATGAPSGASSSGGGGGAFDWLALMLFGVPVSMRILRSHRTG